MGLDLTLTHHDVQKEALPSYNIKKLCNTHYRKSGDHHPYPTRRDRALMEWSRKAIPGKIGEGGGGRMTPPIMSGSHECRACKKQRSGIPPPCTNTETTTEEAADTG